MYFDFLDEKRDEKGYHFSAFGNYEQYSSDVIEYINRKDIKERVFLEINGIEFEVFRTDTLETVLSRYNKKEEERMIKQRLEEEKEEKEKQKWLETDEGKEYLLQGEQDKAFVASCYFTSFDEMYKAIEELDYTTKSPTYYQKLMFFILKGYYVHSNSFYEIGKSHYDKLVSLLKKQGLEITPYSYETYHNLSLQKNNVLAIDYMSNILTDYRKLRCGVYDREIYNLYKWLFTQVGYTPEKIEEIRAMPDDRKQYKYPPIVSEHEYNMARIVKILEEEIFNNSESSPESE